MRPWFCARPIRAALVLVGQAKGEGALLMGQFPWFLMSPQVRTFVIHIPLQLYSASLHHGGALYMWVWDTILIAFALRACDKEETPTRRKMARLLLCGESQMQ